MALHKKQVTYIAKKVPLYCYTSTALWQPAAHKAVEHVKKPANYFISCSLQVSEATVKLFSSQLPLRIWNRKRPMMCERLILILLDQ